MDESDFEGSLILEKLASMNLVDEFFEAIDSDNVTEVVSILRDADIEDEFIQVVLKKMQE